MRKSIIVKTNLGREFELFIRKTHLRRITGWQIRLLNSKNPTLYPGKIFLSSVSSLKGMKLSFLVSESPFYEFLYQNKELDETLKNEIIVEIIT